MEERQDGNIIQRDIEEEMRTAYIDFAMSVIVARALPDVREEFYMLCMKTELHQINHIGNVLIP